MSVLCEWTLRLGDNNVLETAQFDTADFGEAIFGGPGNLWVDHVLPSNQLRILDAGVFWPADEDSFGWEVTGPGFPAVSSEPAGVDRRDGSGSALTRNLTRR